MKSSFVVSSINRILGKDTFTLPDNVVLHAHKCNYDINSVHSQCVYEETYWNAGKWKAGKMEDNNRTVHQLQFPPWGLSVGQEISGSYVS
jgi:hypothetical protein